MVIGKPVMRWFGSARGLERRFKKQRAFVFILITIVVDGIGAGLMAPIFPQLLVELTQGTIVDAAVVGGWLTVLFSAMQFFSAPVLGNLSDHCGRRPILLISLAALGIEYLMMGMAPSIGWLFVATAFAGIFAATPSAANAYIVDVSEPEERPKQLGMLSSAFGVGFMLGPMLGGMLSNYGTRMPFLVSAAIALLNVTYGIFVLPESLPVENRRRFSIAQSSPVGTLRQIRSQKYLFRLLSALGFLQIAIVTVPITWGYFTMFKFGWSPRQVGVSLSLYASANIVVQGFLVGYVTRWLGHRRTVCVGLSFTIISLCGYAWAAESWMMLACIVPAAIGLVSAPAIISYMSTNISLDRQGQLQGAVTSIASVATIMTPLVMTRIFSYFSSKDATIFFPGAPYLLAALSACFGLFLVISFGSKCNAEQVRYHGDRSS